ncbi:hypothetical protein EYC79_03810 [Agrobacterium cavarae]|uniref:Uncharacterized protein n=1 Tax=Agrobacterium cavarae TaxID=2528239 RepID=A0ABY1YDC1_9HYPH|nr:hypothetical protein [Agrobacterium cavarae]TBN16947.1 hypothetical protein EYC79_03810 [Agrobacterium cavarae]
METWFTVLVAFLAACFTGMQWFVARQQFVLALFDRRFAAYNAVLDSVRPVQAKGNADENDINQFKIAAHNSKFLFGSDVSDYLSGMLTTIAQLKYGNTIYKTADPKAGSAPDIMLEANLKLVEFFDKYPLLCQPYMIMPERRFRNPIEWASDLTKVRKNYGGESQKIQ